MKIVLFIDSLTSGGAQRQLTCLARLLTGQGHDVSVLVYYDKAFFKAVLDQEPRIPVHLLKWSGQFSRLFEVWKFMRREGPQLVISFLHVPNFLSSLVRICGVGFNLIVSERDNDLKAPNLRVKCRLWMHRAADFVVPNSHAQAAYLNRYAPFLKSKLSVISNCVDLDSLAATPALEKTGDCDCLKLVILARIEEQKNGLRLAQALGEYEKTRADLPQIVVDWYGRENHAAQGVRPAIEEQLRNSGALDRIRFHDAVKDVGAVYRSADALCLPSLHEGCANVICEAMASGLPVLASRAGDNAWLVKHEENGYIFDELCVEAIVDAFRSFARMTAARRLEFGRSSRLRAEEMLSKERFVQEWSELIEIV
jgi:glycosyltransferase involved in cell wall biosynthesis